MAKRTLRKKTKRAKPATALALPLVLSETVFASMQTIGERTRLITQGRCSVAEYRRMVAEKAAAAQETGKILAGARGPVEAATLLAPWHRRVKANARRLSKR